MSNHIAEENVHYDTAIALQTLEYRDIDGYEDCVSIRFIDHLNDMTDIVEIRYEQLEVLRSHAEAYQRAAEVLEAIQEYGYMEGVTRMGMEVVDMTPIADGELTVDDILNFKDDGEDT